MSRNNACEAGNVKEIVNALIERSTKALGPTIKYIIFHSVGHMVPDRPVARLSFPEDGDHIKENET